jgi:hypothetical protein
MVFGAFVLVVLGLRLLDIPRPLGTIMGVYLAANSFLTPAFPGAPGVSMQRRVVAALITGVVGGYLIHLLDRL